MRNVWNGLLVTLAVLFMTTAGRAQTPSAPGSTTSQSSINGAAPDISAYQLGPGDKIRMITFDEATLTGEFDVSGDGNVDLPLVGEVRALGLTTAEFSRAVEAVLKNKGYLIHPKVSVEVMNYRPFYILGEVGKPGEYPYTNGLTVLNAVATANGFTYRADTKHAYIKRANDTTEHKYELTPETAVAPGDTIRIGERYF